MDAPTCLRCGRPISEEVTSLRCGHVYHHDCAESCSRCVSCQRHVSEGFMNNEHYGTLHCPATNEAVCGICLDTIFLNGGGVFLGCGHIYHQECLAGINDKKCPFCRVPFRLSSRKRVVRLFLNGTQNKVQARNEPTDAYGDDKAASTLDDSFRLALIREITTLKDQNEQLEIENRRLLQKTQDLEQQLSGMVRSFAQATKELQDERFRIRELSTHNAKLKRDSAKSKALLSENEKLRKQVNDNSREIEELRRMHNVSPSMWEDCMCSDSSATAQQLLFSNRLILQTLQQTRQEKLEAERDASLKASKIATLTTKLQDIQTSYKQVVSVLDSLKQDVVKLKSIRSVPTSRQRHGSHKDLIAETSSGNAHAHVLEIGQPNSKKQNLKDHISHIDTTFLDSKYFNQDQPADMKVPRHFQSSNFTQPSSDVSATRLTGDLFLNHTATTKTTHSSINENDQACTNSVLSGSNIDLSCDDDEDDSEDLPHLNIVKNQRNQQPSAIGGIQENITNKSSSGSSARSISPTFPSSTNIRPRGRRLKQPSSFNQAGPSFQFTLQLKGYQRNSSNGSFDDASDGWSNLVENKNAKPSGFMSIQKKNTPKDTFVSSGSSSRINQFSHSTSPFTDLSPVLLNRRNARPLVLTSTMPQASVSNLHLHKPKKHKCMKTSSSDTAFQTFFKGSSKKASTSGTVKL